MKIKKRQLFKSLFKRNRPILENQASASASFENPLPKLRSEEFELTPKADELDAFNKLVHWKDAHHLAPTWLQMVSLPAYLNLITDPRFPFGPLGLVHVSNEVTLYQPLPVEANYKMFGQITEYQSHPKGMLIKATVTGTLNNQKVYESNSSFLAIIAAVTKQSKRKSKSVEFAVNHTMEQTWPLESATGKHYARISWDYNLIHLNPFTAKLFGFKRHIAHGMYLNARALSVVFADENFGVYDNLGKEESALTMSMEFKKPVFLPGQVNLGYSEVDGVIQFDLYNKTSLHASGQINRA